MTRAEAIDILKNTIVRFGRANGKVAYVEALQMAIKALEAEPKTGHWIEFPNHNAYKCSECGRIIETVDGKNNVYKHYPYCHCGARMEGEEHETD